MRKLITLLMAITIIFTLSCPAFAATIEMAKTTAETMRGKQIEANINDLLESYKTTNDAAKQTAIFNELVAYYNELDEMEYYHSDITPLASNYVTFIKATVNNNKATIKYKVNMAIPNGATIRIGFDYPSSWRQTEASFYPMSTVGTHSDTISTNIMMGARYFVKLTANSYTEKQPYEKYYGGLKTDGQWNEFTHIVDNDEVLSNAIATDIAFSLISEKVFISTGSTTTCQIALFLAGQAIDTYRSVTPHKLAVGQCHVTGIQFDGDTVRIKSSMYSSASDFYAGRTPMETNTHSFLLTGYPTN